MAVVLRTYTLKKNGQYGKKKVVGQLKKFGPIRGYQVLTDLPLTNGKKTSTADGILVGYFGLMVVSAVQDIGEYYGDLDSEKWIRYWKERKYFLENTYARNHETAMIIRDLLSREKIYRVPVDEFVVFTGKKSKVLVCIKNGGELIPYSSFKSLLGRSKYEEDKGYNVEQIAEILRSHQAQGTAQ